MNNDAIRDNIERFVNNIKFEERHFGIRVWDVEMSVRFRDYIAIGDFEYVDGDLVLTNHCVKTFTVDGVMSVIDKVIEDVSSRPLGKSENVPVAMICEFTYRTSDRSSRVPKQELTLWMNEDDELINTARSYSNL